MREALEMERTEEFDLPLLMEILELNGREVEDRYCRFGEVTSLSKGKVRFNHPKLIEMNDEVTVFITDPKRGQSNDITAKLKIITIKMKEFLSNEYCCEIENMIKEDIGCARLEESEIT
ncbi:MAG: hypothetical protein ABH875_07125 [Candidatus Omnitrophota bacterium]